MLEHAEKVCMRRIHGAVVAVEADFDADDDDDDVVVVVVAHVDCD